MQSIILGSRCHPNPRATDDGNDSSEDDEATDEDSSGGEGAEDICDTTGDVATG